MTLAHHASEVRAVCVNALVRICAGGVEQSASLPRPSAKIRPVTSAIVRSCNQRLRTTPFVFAARTWIKWCPFSCALHLQPLRVAAIPPESARSCGMLAEDTFASRKAFVPNHACRNGEGWLVAVR